jgi:hypothetical protein
MQRLKTPDPAANFFLKNSPAAPCEPVQDDESIDESIGNRRFRPDDSQNGSVVSPSMRSRSAPVVAVQRRAMVSGTSSRLLYAAGCG